MFWFLNQILGALIAGILYPLLITAPLHILNGIYKAFSFCCGADLGEILFNSQQGRMVIDVNSPLFKFLITAVIISLVLMVVFIIALTIEHLATKKKVNFLSKLKWPLLAITSTVTIPVAFILISSLSSVLMELVGGTTIHYYIEAAHVSDIITNMTNGINGLANSLLEIQIQLTDKDGQLIMANVQQAIQLIEQAVIQIQKEAASANLQDIVEKCSRTLEYLSNVRNTLTNMPNIQTEFKEVLDWIANNIKSGHVVTSSEIANKLKDVVAQLTTVQTSWSSAINGLSEVLKGAQTYSFHCLEETVKLGDSEFVIEELLKPFIKIAEDPWTTEPLNNIWLEFNRLWIDGTGTEQLSLLSVMFNGGEWKGIIGGVERTVTCGEQSYLNWILVSLDPSECNTFDLVVKIYQLVTGNTDANWAWTMPWNMSKGVSLINVGVGFIIIVGAIFVCGLFGLMAARRLIELAVLAVWSVIAAIIGIKDDGAKFNNTVKLIIVKMFCIVVAWAAFSLSVTLLSSITGWIESHNNIDKTSLAWGAVTAIVMVGGLLGAYHMSMLLQQWMGDSTSLQGTIADMGAMGAMMGAGKLVGIAALGAKGIAGGAKAGKKKANIRKQDKEGLLSELKAMKAEKLGLGKAKYELNSSGKMQFAGFKLNDKMKGSKDAFNKLQVEKKEFKLFRQQRKKGADA